MTIITEDLLLDGLPIVRLKNTHLQVDVAPSVGGRIVSLVNKPLQRQFLWRHAGLKLERLAPGSPYDPNFYGGIDELLPNDIPEAFNGADNADHGELWTCPLAYRISNDSLILTGMLPVSGLTYERTLTMEPDAPRLRLAYRIGNTAPDERVFLWKLHAALNIAAGDQIICPARTARVVDLQWCRWQDTAPFQWPVIAEERADVIPAADDTMAFLYLYDLAEGRMAWRSADQRVQFSYQFDQRVFPYCWYFASYGGFDGHYVAILEPCTTMPLSVNEAAALGQCSRLQPGESLTTNVTIYAGLAHEDECHDV